MPMSVEDYPALSSEGSRRVVMSEALFMDCVRMARREHPETIIQVRWPEHPVVETVTHWEPIITVVTVDPNAET